MRPYQHRGIQIFALLTAVVAAPYLTAACGSDAARQCRVGADCASGACGADGQCVVQGTTPNGIDAGGSSSDAASGGDAAGKDAAAQGDSSAPGCVPNQDGTITREEVPIEAGLHATYRVGTNEDISTAGTPRPDGTRSWDYSAMLASDVSVLIETLPLTGKWYASKFPTATYATTLSQGSDLLGVFETTPGALLLRGVVSPTQTATTTTELTYTPAVPALAFPLKVSGTWTTNAQASGTAMGVDVAFAPTAESYVSTVDAAGDLKTPLGTFKVLRVATVLTRQVGIAPAVVTTIIRSFAFVTECYGTIATVTSSNNETTAEFTHAAEIRRISP